MYPKGIIYSSSDSRLSATVNLHAPITVKLIFAVLRAFGASIASLPFVFAIFSFEPIVRQEIRYKTQEHLPRQEVIFDEGQVVHTINVQNEAKTLGINPHFSIYVPKIDAKANIAANVSANDEKVYMEVLRDSVAHAAGTHFPGEGKLVYLFSHSTTSPWWAARLGAQFYLLNKLAPEDQIMIFFADKKYEYKVSEIKVVEPSDTSWLKEQNQGEMLILQTCTPAGTTLRRLLVIAKPAAS